MFNRHLLVILALFFFALLPAAAATPSIPLRYDPALTADGFPSPLVTFTVGGQSVDFIVDTGAAVHTVASWFVAAAELQAIKSNHVVIGTTGHKSTVKVVHDLRAAVTSGRILVLRQAVVADFPPVFEKRRIAGLISPQLLAGKGEDVVLDLAQPRLSFRPAARQLPNSGNVEQYVSGRVCANKTSPFENRVYATSVLLNGTEAVLLIDTGATGTMVTNHSRLASTLGSRSIPGGESQAVGGPTERIALVPSVTVERGGSNVRVDVRLGTAQNGCGEDGMLGMDALRPCLLVMGKSRFSMTCRAASVTKQD